MGFKNLLARFRLKKDTASKWSSNNPVLMDGEPGVEVNGEKVKMKIGDGSTPYNSLPYLTGDETALQEVMNAGQKNLFQSNLTSSATNHGITMRPNGDGTFYVSGKNIDETSWLLLGEFKVKPGTYILSGGNPIVWLYVSNTGNYDKGGGVEYSCNEETTIRIGMRVGDGNTVSETICPMFCKKALYNLDPTFQPYAKSNAELTKEVDDAAQKFAFKSDLDDYLPLNGNANSASFLQGDHIALSGKTLTDMRNKLDELAAKATETNTAITTVRFNCGNWLTLWNDNDTSTPCVAGFFHTFTLIAAYKNSTYQAWLAQTYTENSTYIIVKENNVWKSAQRVALEENFLPINGNANSATFAGTRWTAQTQGQKWSRIYKLDSSNVTTGSSGILSISCTRGSVVCNASFFITISHAASEYVTCTQLSGNNYTPIKYRIVANNSGSYYFEIYDEANNIASGTLQVWSCCYTPFLSSSIVTYTSFTDGTTIPSGYKSFGACITNMIFGINARANGNGTKAKGSVSYADGEGTISSAYQYAVGMYNEEVTGGNLGSMESKGTAFVVGNGYSVVGTDSSYIRSNACRITYDGQVIGKKNYAATGADYAELREWLDGNPDNEDRRGYFVTLVGDKIKNAEPGDYIEGIISGNPAVLGNHDECWMGKNLRDEFGGFIYEDVEIMNEETGEISIGKHYKINPDYDPEQEYIPRQDRKEWSAVGMLGHLSVRDDGSCQPNGYCHVGHGGIATISEKGYRVVKRISENIVEIVFSIYAQF